MLSQYICFQCVFLIFLYIFCCCSCVCVCVFSPFLSALQRHPQWDFSQLNWLHVCGTHCNPRQPNCSWRRCSRTGCRQCPETFSQTHERHWKRGVYWVCVYLFVLISLIVCVSVSDILFSLCFLCAFVRIRARTAVLGGRLCFRSNTTCTDIQLRHLCDTNTYRIKCEAQYWWKRGTFLGMCVCVCVYLSVCVGIMLDSWMMINHVLYVCICVYMCDRVWMVTKEWLLICGNYKSGIRFLWKHRLSKLLWR